LGGIWVALFIFILLAPPSEAKMGYDIVVKVGTTTWELNRTTQALNFSMEGTVTGTGNFSRLTHIDRFAGIKADERSSSTRAGSLEIGEKMLLRAREGPVVVTAKLRSGNFTNRSAEGEEKAKYDVSAESAEIQVDEIWPTGLANYKKISYVGPGIRTAERYENNGDVVATSIDSRRLSKESLYRTYINRTIIYAMIKPGSVVEERGSNRSSIYQMDLKSSGSSASLDLIKLRGIRSEEIYGRVEERARISEEYRGDVEARLNVRMDESIHPWDISPREWLPCCHGGYFDMSKGDRKFSSADKIFDCSCRNSSISRMSGGTGA
jgi:hypothetical protein